MASEVGVGEIAGASRGLEGGWLVHRRMGTGTEMGGGAGGIK